MNSTPNPPEPLPNPTHFGGDGSHASAESEEDAQLRVQLGEILDADTRDDLAREDLIRDERIRERIDLALDDSLQSLERSAQSMVAFVKKNPLPVMAVVGGIAAVVAALSRRRR